MNEWWCESDEHVGERNVREWRALSFVLLNDFCTKKATNELLSIYVVSKFHLEKIGLM